MMSHHKFLSLTFLGTVLVVVILAVVASGNLLSRTSLDVRDKAAAPELNSLNVIEDPTLEEIEGNLTEIVVDFEDGSEVKRQFIQYRENGKLRETEINYRGHKELRSGMKVRVKGKRSTGNILAIDETANSGTLALVGDASANYVSTGSKKAAVVLFTTQGRALPTSPSVSTINTLFNGASNSVKDFYLKNSFGQFTVENSDIFGWYRLDNIAFNCLDVFEHPYNLIMIDGVSSPLDTPDYRNYDQVFFVVDNASGCGKLGVGSTGNVYFDTAEGSMAMPFASVVKSAATLLPSVHEIGHNLNLQHATGLDCGTDVYRSSGCTTEAYGNMSDTMGSPNGAFHFNYSTKRYLNWINSTKVKTLSASGEVDLYPLETAVADGQFQGLQVNFNGGSFLVENRSRLNYDSSLPTGLSDGIVIRTGGLLDSSPHAGGGKDDFNDAGFGVNQLFHDTEHNVKITALSKNAQNVVRVKVELPGAPPAPPPAVLQNTGFELDTDVDGKPDNWNQTGNFTRVSNVKRSGSYSGKIYSTTNNNITVGQQVAVTAGKYYTFSGFSHIPTTSDQFNYSIQLAWFNSANAMIGSPVVVGSTFTGPTATWTQTTASKLAPTGAVKVAVRMVVTSLNATIYVDDFSFALTPTHLLVNSGFETDANADGKPDAWNQTGNFTRSNASKRNGTYSGRIYSTTNNDVTVGQRVPVVAGRRYYFSGYSNIPATADQFNYSIQLAWFNASNVAIGNPVQIGAAFTASTGGQYVLRTGNAVAPAGATQAAVRMSVTGLNATIYVDDFYFYYYP